jgi:hypothetical protein
MLQRGRAKSFLRRPAFRKLVDSGYLIQVVATFGIEIVIGGVSWPENRRIEARIVLVIESAIFLDNKTTSWTRPCRDRKLCLPNKTQAMRGPWLRGAVASIRTFS